ncbi:MAG: hypothetical protein ACO1TE_05635 [Prosthecobacter sp.]
MKKYWTILVCAFMCFSAYTKALAFNPPAKTYHDFSWKIGGVNIGILETEKVVEGEFRRKIVPGRQVICRLGPYDLVIPLFLWQLSLILIFCIATLILVVKNLKNRRLKPPGKLINDIARRKG